MPHVFQAYNVLHRTLDRLGTDLPDDIVSVATGFYTARNPPMAYDVVMKSAK